MGKNMLSEKKRFHIFALTFFCPNEIPVGSRDISNHDDARTSFQSSDALTLCMLDFRFEKGNDHPARGVDSTQIRTANRAIGVHSLVRQSCDYHRRKDNRLVTNKGMN